MAGPTLPGLVPFRVIARYPHNTLNLPFPLHTRMTCPGHSLLAASCAETRRFTSPGEGRESRNVQSAPGKAVIIQSGGVVVPRAVFWVNSTVNSARRSAGTITVCPPSRISNGTRLDSRSTRSASASRTVSPDAMGTSVDWGSTGRGRASYAANAAMGTKSETAAHRRRSHSGKPFHHVRATTAS